MMSPHSLLTGNVTRLVPQERIESDVVLGAAGAKRSPGQRVCISTLLSVRCQITPICCNPLDGGSLPFPRGFFHPAWLLRRCALTQFAPSVILRSSRLEV